LCFSFLSFLSGGFFANINRALGRSLRERAQRAPFPIRLLLQNCGLFTKKFGLYFKGSAASGRRHSPRHLYAQPSASEKVGSDKSFLKRNDFKRKTQKF